MTIDTVLNLVLLLGAVVIILHFTLLSVQVYRSAKHLQRLSIIVARLQEECDAAWGKPIKVLPVGLPMRMRYRVEPGGSDPKRRH